MSLYWKCRVLSTVLSGKFLAFLFFSNIFSMYIKLRISQSLKKKFYKFQQLCCKRKGVRIFFSSLASMHKGTLLPLFKGHILESPTSSSSLFGGDTQILQFSSCGEEVPSQNLPRGGTLHNSSALSLQKSQHVAQLALTNALYFCQRISVESLPETCIFKNQYNSLQ